ncbi:hypothetical protein [Streptomyces sp. NPDC059398]|uniref:hypothetical protein n=1 Tax=Streptomyces sp. NPDC059398 TaxID=3346820 RepID=UPI003691CBE5
MSRTSLLSVSACAMCPAAAPTERDRAMAAGATLAGPGYHVALHTPSVLTAPVDYHPTALLIGAGAGRHGLIPGARRSPGTPEAHHAAVVNDAHTWRAPEYLRISGERCTYRPWGSAPSAGLDPAGAPFRAAVPLPGADPDQLRSAAHAPHPRPGPVTEGRAGRAVLCYAAGGALLLVIAGVLVRRRAHH